MNSNQLADAIGSVALIQGDFLLRSGASASEYFDKYRFESDPHLLRAIARHLSPLIPRGTEVLAGLELGGVPIVTALSLETGLPAVFVRKRAKEYGTRQLAEGREITAQRLLIIEDVVTSGGQVVESTIALRQRGATVTDALCVIDRASGGAAALAAIGVNLHALFEKEDLSNA
jgi:orotate phosphoribosyltransferase